MMTLIVALLGYLAPLMKHFKLNVSKNVATKVNDTVQFLQFVNETFFEEGF